MSEELIAAITRPAHRHRPTRASAGGDGSAKPSRSPTCATSRTSPVNEIILRAGFRARADRAAAASRRHRRRAGGAAQGARRIPADHRRPAADLRGAVGAGDPERPAVPRDRGEEPAARGREPAQVAVPRQHEPRAAHAAQRHPRLHRADPRRHLRRDAGQDAQRARARAEQRQAPARPDQRRARPVQDRGRPAHAVARRLFDQGRRAQRVRRGRAAGQRARSSRFKVEVPPDLPTGRGDERRLTQVLLNLVGNAIKFTDTGEVAIKAAAANGAFTVAVRDTGPGIAAADQGKIFEEFQQVDSSITQEEGRHRARACRSPSASSRCTAAASGSSPNSGRARPSRSRVPVKVEQQARHA